ncbi:hypothetical protein K0M31_018747 [Melipona bicolor]|uniref:Uncharacterized protein n=1 Tax=Melipona bicolor TaxID=60889 RepID=A0AA40KRZ7_9HYME|nr:hypothetical protein K0M31_018747 [Melipona bicolor]
MRIISVDDIAYLTADQLFDRPDANENPGYRRSNIVPITFPRDSPLSIVDLPDYVKIRASKRMPIPCKSHEKIEILLQQIQLNSVFNFTKPFLKKQTNIRKEFEGSRQGSSCCEHFCPFLRAEKKREKEFHFLIPSLASVQKFHVPRSWKPSEANGSANPPGHVEARAAAEFSLGSGYGSGNAGKDEKTRGRRREGGRWTVYSRHVENHEAREDHV